MKIVVLDGKVINPGDISWDALLQLGTTRIYDTTEECDLEEHIGDADVVLVNKVPLGKKTLPFCKNVRFVGLLATGYDNVDIQAFAEKGIPVCNVVAYGVEDVAQHAFALLLELCRSTSMHSESVKQGEWQNTWCYWKKTPVCLAGLTMGILGFGTIGRCVGRIAHAFGMKVLANNRSQKDPETYTPFAYVSQKELFRNSDVISLHCPLTPKTRGIINAETIALMKKGTIIINTARGPLLDEQACAQALESGALGGLGCDVLAKEPPDPNNPLLSAKNTLITPHMAWATVRARQTIIDRMAESIRNFFSGKPNNVVNGVTTIKKD